MNRRNWYSYELDNHLLEIEGENFHIIALKQGATFTVVEKIKGSKYGSYYVYPMSYVIDSATIIDHGIISDEVNHDIENSSPYS